MNPGPGTKPHALRFSPGDRVTLHHAGHDGFDPALEGEEGVVIEGDLFLTGQPCYTVDTDLASGLGRVAALEDELSVAK